MNKRQPHKLILLLERLRDWDEELKIKGPLERFAERVISSTRENIRKRWPDALAEYDAAKEAKP